MVIGAMQVSYILKYHTAIIGAESDEVRASTTLVSFAAPLAASITVFTGSQGTIATIELLSAFVRRDGEDNSKFVRAPFLQRGSAPFGHIEIERYSEARRALKRDNDEFVLVNTQEIQGVDTSDLNIANFVYFPVFTRIIRKYFKYTIKCRELSYVKKY